MTDIYPTTEVMDGDGSHDNGWKERWRYSMV